MNDNTNDEKLFKHMTELKQNDDNQDSMVKTNTTPFKLVSRIATILTCLNSGTNSVTEIAKICGVNKSTAHRLLKAMEQAKFTIQDPVHHRHSLGSLIVDISSSPNVTHQHLVSCALKEMSYLSNLTNESIGLAILNGVQSILLHEIPSGHDLNIASRYKVVGKLHAGASTRTQLAELDDKELQITMLNMDFEQITENTITQKKQFMEQIERIRRQGYGVSYGERIPGSITISAPIKNYIVPATINILGPDSRIRPRLNDYINKLLESCARIHDKLMQVNMIRNS
jgi:IclR family KDG regulon transcriptional repressor